MSLLFYFVLALSALIPRSILEIDCIHPPRTQRKPRLINSLHLIQLGASIHPELDENLGPRPEGDDGRRKSSKLSRRWLRPPLAAMASLRGCAMAEFMS